MELVERNENLLAQMNAIYRESGLPELPMGKSNGGSDAADVTMSGVPCIDSIGAEGGEIHSLNEFAYLDSLAESAKRFAVVALQLQ